MRDQKKRIIIFLKNIEKTNIEILKIYKLVPHGRLSWKSSLYILNNGLCEIKVLQIFILAYSLPMNFLNSPFEE